MQVRRRKGAVVVAVAVVASVLGGAPGALADPGTPTGPGATSADRAGGRGNRAGAVQPSVWPRPHVMSPRKGAVTVGDDVALVTAGADEDADPYALDALRDLLRDAGARRVTEVRDGEPLPAGGSLVVRAGGPGADRALRALGAGDRGDLPGGGYR
ncbi:hypothetical protein ABZ383_34360, partial [Streptomyces sp. NPDC005900]